MNAHQFKRKLKNIKNLTEPDLEYAMRELLIELIEAVQQAYSYPAEIQRRLLRLHQYWKRACEASTIEERRRRNRKVQ